MRALTRREVFVAGSGGLLLLALACSHVLGLEPAHERVDAGSIIDATPPDERPLPPIGEKDAACGDTTSDPKNCGECGRDCLGGKCTDGRCEPTVFVYGLLRPRRIAIDDEAVYWSEATAAFPGSAVRRCELSGCPNGPRTLFELKDVSYLAVLVEGDLVYALRTGENGIDTCNRLGCGGYPRFINVPATSLAVAPQRKAYFTTPAPSSSVALPEGLWGCDNTPECHPKTQLLAKATVVRALGADLYVLDEGTDVHDGVILRCVGASCTSPKTLASGISYAWFQFFAAKQGIGWIGHNKDGNVVLFLCEPEGCAGGPKTLARMGGWVETFAFDEKYLYWTNSALNAIERVAWASVEAVPELVLTKQGMPVGITIKDGVLYFARSSFGDIVRYVPPP